MTRLEHVNITVPDPKATAALYARLFGWQVRWEGAATNGGYSVHVGTADDYVALYTGPGDGEQYAGDNSYLQVGGLNHIGVVVDDLDCLESAVLAEGFQTHSHADYEPGRRFYFRDSDGIEIEVVSYTEAG